MTDFKISKGYSVPISGEANQKVTELALPPFLGMCPVEFPGLKSKLSVQVNDEVKVGSPLFFDKKRPEILFLSPAGGRVTAINYGPRRVIEEIIISRGAEEDYEQFNAFDLSEIALLGRDKLITHLQKGGMWPYFRQRPYNIIASAEDTPQAIFVNCMDTAPLANNPNFSLKDKAEDFKTGIAVLNALCAKVHVCTDAGSNVFSGSGQAQTHCFSGKHPAGLVGTHITKIAPINKGELVWYLNARDLVMIGSFMRRGKYPTERVVALAGAGASQPAYYKTRVGISIKHLITGNTAPGDLRFISGNVLSGTAKSDTSFLGYYDDLVSIVPEGRDQHFLGWMMPGFNQPSFTRTFASAFLGGSKKFKMNTNLNGGHRAIIQSGMWEEVVALDVHPEFLVKATIAGDIDAMEQLGILECAPEDFALCTYVCPSKTEVSDIIAQGLELMEKEG